MSSTRRTSAVAVANQAEEQPVGVIEFGAIELAVTEIGEFLHLRGAEVVPCDGIGHFAIAGLDARGIEAGVFKNLHIAGGS